MSILDKIFGTHSQREIKRIKPLAKKVEDFLLSKMDFTEHYVDREVIKQFVHTIVPVTETCFNWYMNFDLIDVPNDMKKLVWEFTIDYKSARSYRKENVTCMFVH